MGHDEPVVPATIFTPPRPVLGPTGLPGTAGRGSATLPLPGGAPMPPARKRKAETGSPQPRQTSGVTGPAQAGLQPHQICHLAGVRDINWLLTYMRESLGDKLRASWSLGL
jgi:hypothetical protein